MARRIPVRCSAIPMIRIMSRFQHSTTRTPALAVLLAIATIGCEDPDAFAEEEALLAEADDDAHVDLDANNHLLATVDDDIEQIGGYVLVSNVSSSGSSVTVPSTDPNNASWVLNAPNGVWGELSRVTATIVHEGFLNGPNGWDHLAVMTRGTTLESSLQYLGFGSGASSAFFWGENLAAAGGLDSPQLNSVIRGRGPTFWAKGASSCPTKNPCLVFENYSLHHFGGNVLVGAGIPLVLSNESFEIRVDTDDWDIKVWVWQGGQLKAYASCLEHTGGDARCGAQPGDGAVGDAGFAFIMQSPIPNYTGKKVGVLSSSSKVFESDPAPCPGCPPY